MRKWLFSIVLWLVVALCAVWVFAPSLLPWNGARQETDVLEAARMLRLQMEGDPLDHKMVFADASKLDQNDLFRALEATWPYAFSLHATTHQNGMLTVEIEIENAAAQQQAETLAQGIVHTVISEDMTLSERLRALHDYVVRGCVYDLDTADQETLAQGSGADAPFTAAGALVDGKAVCAGYSRAFMMLCRAAGIDTVYLADMGMNHGWNAVRLYDEILYVDTTFDDPVPDRGELVSTAYFLKDREEFERTHVWDQAFYDRVIAMALPADLSAPQRLFDLGLLSEPPTADEVLAPLTAADRRTLEGPTGLTLPREATLGSAGAFVWQAVCQDGVAQRLLDAGITDEVRARHAGVPEEAVAPHEK